MRITRNSEIDRNGGMFFLFFSPTLPKHLLVSSRLVKDSVVLAPAIIVVNIIASCAPGPVNLNELESGVINVHPDIVNVGLLHLSSLTVTCFRDLSFIRALHPIRLSLGSDSRTELA
jgi:hypothetical protein